MNLEEVNYKFKYEKIENIWQIFWVLSDTTSSSMDYSIGKNGMYAVSGETMMSISNTIQTIDFCCYRGAYSDAYTLIRKCRDDLMQYLFVLNVIQNKHGLTDQEIKNFSLEPDALTKLVEMSIYILASGERKSEQEFATEKWVYGELGNPENSKIRKKFFDTSKYKIYLMSNNEHIKYIFDNFLADKWKNEDRKLNNYVHTNGMAYLMNNYIFQENKIQKDNELIETLRNIIDIFLSMLVIIDSIKVHSSDYIDALEMGMEPPENSQYWVASVILDYMNERFDKDLLSYLQENEGHGMQLLEEYYQ